MLGKFSYLVYMLIFTLVPVGFLWIKKFQFLKKNIKVIFYTVIIGIILQLITDPIALGLNIWSYSPEKVIGIWILGFPIEDVLFFILVPFAISSAVLIFIHCQMTGKWDRFFK